jgi:chromosome segregation protein
MHIQLLDIDNFKSFSGRTLIPFRKGFTTVSGPNGSGKSNIVDSLLFCLGLSSSRTMRADKLGDLINNTSRRREASVTVVFNCTADDPPLPTHLATPQGDETPDAPSYADYLANLDPAQLVTISRRIKQTPSGVSSTYILNGQVTTLTEIHELLAQYHVSPGSYNVMMQGDVASIVTMSATERRKIVDELAGIAEFDRKIERAQTELSQAADTAKQNEVLLTEIESRLGELEGERNKALKYQALKEQLATCKAQEALAELKTLLEQQASLQAQHHSRTEQVTFAKAQVTDLQEASQQATSVLQALNHNVRQKGEDQHIAIQKQAEVIKGHVARKEQQLALLDEQDVEAQQQRQRLDEQQAQAKRWLAERETTHAMLTQQRTELEGMIATEKANLAEAHAQFEAWSSQDGERAAHQQQARQAWQTAQDALATRQRALLDGQAQHQRQAQGQQQQQQRLHEAQSRRQSLEQRYTALAKAFEAMETEKAQLDDALRQATTDLTTAKAAAQRYAVDLPALERQVFQLEAQRRAMEEVSFSRAVDAILQQPWSGVHGTVAQLAQADPDAQLALEIALGGRVQNIVVDDDGVAKEGIEWLKQRKLGRVTFLPLNKIKGQRAPHTPPNHAGVVDYAINLMQFGPCYDTVFAFALGDTLIVESIDMARPLMGRYRMVTLDGSLLEKTGAMTGGSTKQGGQGLLRNTSQHTAELANLQDQLTTLKHQAEVANKACQRHQTKVDELQGQQHALLPKHSRTLAELETLEAHLAEQRQLEAELAKAPVALATVGEALPNLDVLQAAVAQAEAQVAETHTALQAMTDTEGQNQLAALRDRMKEAQFQLDYLEGQLRHVLTQLQQHDTQNQMKQAALDDYENQCQQLAAKVLQRQAERQQHAHDRQGYEAQLAELDEAMAALGSELQQLRAERDKAQQALLAVERDKDKAERSLAEATDAVQSLNAQLSTLGFNLNGVRQHLHSQGIDTSEAALSSVPTATEVAKTAASLQQRMATLEPVNMLAIKEYERVTSRQADLRDKVDTLQREQDELRMRITGYEELKRVYFTTAFTNVNEQFKTIYAELSDGHGQLVLTQPDDPLAGGLTIEASPRGKKTQRLEAMSGGEKSLTSLAFVFALQRTSPAPFYALDEVDQNLDGLNVEKLSRMVQRESRGSNDVNGVVKGAQFIVVSLRKPMIDNSDRTIGVTQQRNGVTKVTGVQFHPDALPQAVG